MSFPEENNLFSPELSPEDKSVSPPESKECHSVTSEQGNNNLGPTSVFAKQKSEAVGNKTYYESVSTLKSFEGNISFTDNVRSFLSEKNNSNNSLVISDDENLLRYCRINPHLLDKSDKGIFLIGAVGNEPIAMMIDTGASCCVMSNRIYESLPLEHRPNLVFKDCGIRSVSGEVTKCHGVATFDVQFGNLKLPVEFHVADICDKVILGMTFLSGFGGTINTKTGTMSIGDQDVPCVILDGKPSPRRVYIPQEIIIPAGREVIIPGKSRELHGNRSSLSSVPMLFEPRQSFFNNHNLMVCASVVLNNSTTVPIRVFNPTEEPVVLRPGKSGFRCGYLTPTTVESEVISRADLVAQVGVDLTKACDNELPEHLQKMFEESCENLTAEEQEAVRKKLIQYQDVFSKGDTDLGKTHLAEHKIVTNTEQPIKQRPRPLPQKQSEEVERQIRLLLKSGMISESDSAWSSPIVCVTKKDKSLRMCCDYRKLNDVTIKDAHPIPPINQTIDALSGAKYFCSLDLASGYYQVPMSAESKDKTAFCTRSGLYHWNVMSFGLTNAPATFQRLMSRVLKNLHWSICMCYLDDILVFGSSVSEVLDRLEVILIRLRQAGLKLKPKKCHLFQTEILYLGYKISAEGVHTDPAKIQDVKDFPRPKDIQGVRRFLGLTNYYRKFIESYAKLAFPLNRLLDKPDKKAPFLWSDECEQAFNTLKEKLITAPILALPRENGMYYLDTDSSAEGIGGVLQQMQDDKLVVIAYSSKALSAAERNYCVSRQELLSIVYHIDHFRCYLWGNHFKVRSDHASLRYLISFKNPNGQLARWIDALSEYDFEILTRPGKSNGNADAMSRIPCGGKKCYCTYSCSDPTLEEFQVHPCVENLVNYVSEQEEIVCEDVDANSVFAVEVDSGDPEVDSPKPSDTEFPFPWTSDTLRKAQRHDPVISKVIQFLEKGTKPVWHDISHLNSSLKSFMAGWKNLELVDGVLFRKNLEAKYQVTTYQLVIPEIYREHLLHYYHETKVGGHLGVDKVYAKLRTKYFWPEMYESVVLYIRTCLCCQKKKSPPKSYCAPLKKYVVGVPFERVACDIMGPMPETERHNKYVLVVSDYFTRWVEAYPLVDQKSETIASVIASEWVTRFGCMSELYSDNGTNFVSEIMQDLCSLLSIERLTTIVRRPQSDGVCERFNHTVQSMLATALTDCVWDWDLLLPFLLMAYRSSRHESTGFSPNKMLFGRENILPVEAFTPETPDQKEFQAAEYVVHIQKMLQESHEKAMSHLQKAVEYQQRSYLNRLKSHRYQIKDPVWYWRPVFKRGECPKLLTFWTGPFFVVEVISDVVYRIQRNAKCRTQVVHHNQLKPCHLRDKPNTDWIDASIQRSQTRNNELQLPHPEDFQADSADTPVRRSARKRAAPVRFDNRIGDPELVS